MLTLLFFSFELIQEAIVNMSRNSKNNLVLPVQVQALLVKMSLVAWMGDFLVTV